MHAPVAARVLRTREALDGLRDRWTGSACATPFQQFAWIAAAADTLAAPRQLRVLTVEAGGSSAMLPLVRRFDRGPRLEVLGSRELYEPVDAICTDPDVAVALASAARTLAWPLLLGRLPAESRLVAAFRERQDDRVSIVPAPATPWLPLDDSWSEPDAHFSARRRSDLLRARRAAERLGPLTCEVHAPSPDTLDPLLEQALVTEAAGWKGRSGTALLADSRRGPFYRRVARDAAEHGTLRLGFLRVGDRIAAMQMLVEHRGRLWLLKMGYDPAFARCSPGLLLMVAMVRRAALDGLAAFEFLGIDEPWLRPWQPVLRPHVAVRVLPRGILGHLAGVVTRRVTT